MEKLYIVTRSDLSPGARLAQSAHAAIAFVLAFPESSRTWHDSSNNLVILEAPSEDALQGLAARAAKAGVPCVTFQEPDMGGTTTAVALGRDAARLVSSLPLALRVAKAA